MRIEMLKGTVAALGLGAALLPWTIARAADASENQRPSLAGRWELVPDQSDDPGKAVDFLTAGRQPRTDANGQPGGGGWGGGGGRGGMGGGGRGGFGGGGRGGMGGGGWGRGQRGGEGGDYTPPTPEERAAMHDAVKNAIEGGPTMQIADTGSDLTIQFPEGRLRHLTTDGHKSEANRLSLQAQWKKDHLELKTETRRLKIKENWTLGPQAGQLSVEVHAKREDTDGELVLRRVYRQVADSSPAGVAAEPGAIKPEGPSPSAP